MKPALAFADSSALCCCLARQALQGGCSEPRHFVALARSLLSFARPDGSGLAKTGVPIERSLLDGVEAVCLDVQSLLHHRLEQR